MTDFEPTPTLSRSLGDIFYDGIFSGAIGGSAVALLFVVVDLINGEALFTPSLLGSVMFEGADAASVTGVSLVMVAFFTPVHFAVFGVVGMATSITLHRAEQTHHPVLVMVILFLSVEVVFLAGAWLFMPGVVPRIGLGVTALANLFAAGSMAGFLVRSHRPDLWVRLKDTVHAA